MRQFMNCCMSLKPYLLRIVGLDRELRVEADVLRGVHGAVPLGVDVDDLAADFLAVDQLVEREAVARVAAALVADLAEFAGFFHGFDHGAGAVDGVGHHLLAIDVEAGFEAFHGVRRVPEIRGGDDDGVEAFLGGEHFVDVRVALGRVALEGADLGHAALEVVVPDVADGLEVEAGDVGHGLEQDAALFADADEGDVDLVRRRPHWRRGGCEGAPSTSPAPAPATVFERKSRRLMEEGGGFMGLPFLEDGEAVVVGEHERHDDEDHVDAEP